MRAMRPIILALVLFVLAAPAQAGPPRIALVIGNSEYESGPLPNPANDAKLIAETLTDLGFEVVLRRNADQNAMKRAIQDFGARLEKAGPQAIGLFYYAGHGAQLNGRNYLIPTTARIEREGDMEIEAVAADWVIEQMRYARNGLNIVILDACRNNPFTRSMRSMDRGLATMDAPAGILIAYSTAPGEVAADGSGRNSPYTEALTRNMRELHEPVEQVFKRVRIGVMSATSGKQVPWESSSLTGDFYFTAPAQVAPPTSAGDSGSAPGVPTPGLQTAPDRDAAKPSGSSSSIGSFFSGLFSSNSKPATEAGGTTAAGTSAAAGPLIPGTRAVALLQSLGIETATLDATRSYPESLPRTLLEHAMRRVTVGSSPEQIRAAFALCQQYSAACQLSWYSDEQLRTATLAPYRLDALPVSVAAFRQFVTATGYKTEAETLGYAYAVVGGSLREVSGGNWRNAVKKRAINDEAAVVAVSYQDAAAYCLSKGERLPSEDEWEFAARGPERHIFPWGDGVEPATQMPQSPPRVGDGPPEGIGGAYRGLAGNVWQWVDTKVEGRRVLKGGSWLEPNPANKRAAARRYELARRADEDSGFRCAKSVDAWPDSDYWLARLR
jgi:formylglycine-generating enzyme required for sulfatase activity